MFQVLTPDITLEIHENRTKLTPLYNNGTVSLIIDIYPVVTIDDSQELKILSKRKT